MVKIKLFNEIIDYQAYQDGMYLDKIKVRLMNDKTFIRVFKRNLTENFINSLKAIVDPNIKHEQNFVLSVSGETGSSKSMSMLSLAKMIVGDRFTYKNMCFFDTQILSLAETIPRDSIIIRDEGVDKAIYGVGSQRTSRQLTILTETARKYGLSIIFIEPSFRENEVAKYYLQTIDVDYENRITRLAIKDAELQEYLGALYIPVVDDNDEDWIRYNHIKDKFIEDVKSGKLTDAKQDYREMAREIINLIDIDLYEKKKDRLAFMRAELPNLTNAEIDIVATFVEVMIKSGKASIEKE